MKFIDLTMPVNESTPLLPSARKPTFERTAIYERDGWNGHRVSLSTHFGTHIDAPWHLVPKGKKLSDFPIDALIGRATVFDVRGQKEILINDSAAPEHDILLLRTDHTKSGKSPGFFTDFPILTMESAVRMAERRIKILGIDSWTIDLPPHKVHKYLLKRDILIVENLVNLDECPEQPFTVYVLPLKLDNTDGAPCRVIAQTNRS